MNKVLTFSLVIYLQKMFLHVFITSGMRNLNWTELKE